ncbi:MAG: spore germination protein [Tumebacillaceae bacterium]
MFKGLLQALVKKISLMDGANNLRADMEVEEIAFTEDEAENCRLVVDAVNNSSDVIWETLGSGSQKHCILFIKSLIDVKVQNRDLIRPLQVMQTQGAGLDKMVNGVAVGQKKKALHLDDAVALLLDGWTLLAVSQIKGFYAFKTSQTPGRGVEKAENQSIVLGPQEAFCESLEANLGLIRKRLKTPFLQVENIKVGALTHTNVAILSIKDLTNDRYLQDIRNRIKELDIDVLLDSGTLTQLIDDQPFSPFPQFNEVERPDSVVANLCEGKVAVLVDGTPYVFLGPSSFIEFFHSPEDYFNRWMSASLLRLLRLFGVIVSITFSAIYVAVLTYHYEIIPANMLKTIALSRAKVPFPPLYEALFLELTLEVLREAGERLPTKVGQTMGIVGGIVIGQAAVSAGLTSNVMIIVVSLSALASFVTPSYVMGNAVRVIRFPIIVLSGLLGFVGLSIGLVTILIHLLNLSSLGAPYMSPWAPMRLADIKDTIVRFPTHLMQFRPTLNKTKRDRKMSKVSLKRK